jgi:hypothetical protein
VTLARRARGPPASLGIAVWMSGRRIYADAGVPEY